MWMEVGDHVVTGLAPIDVVVGVDGVSTASWVPQHLVGAVGKNLIHIHVAGSSRTRLENIQGKVFGEFSFNGFFGGLADFFRQEEHPQGPSRC